MKQTGLLLGLLLTINAHSQTADKAFEPYEQTIPGTSVKFKMVPIAGGNFKMGGSEADQKKKPDETPQRSYSVSPFWMGTHEVTHDEYLLFFNDEEVSRNFEVVAVSRPTSQYIDLSWGMGKQGGFPTNSMSQQNALMYCRWLYKKTGHFYRLPTEAEWEYACRAGSNTAYPFGDDPSQLGDYAWYSANSSNKYQRVGQKKPNQWGLYDILGNVAEWTLDQYDEQYFSKFPEGTADPVIEPVTRYPRSVRGGGYGDKPEHLRSSSRWKSDPSWNKRDPQIPKSKWWLTDAAEVGFRIVRPLNPPPPDQIEAFYKKYLGN